MGKGSETEVLIDTKRMWKAIVIGDAFISPDTMEAALRESDLKVQYIKKLFWGSRDKNIYTKMQQRVERYGPEAEPWAEGLEDVIEDADLIFHCYAPLCKEILEKGKELKVILTCRSGTEQIDMDYCTKRHIQVETVVRNKTAVAEFVVGQMIALTRNIAVSDRKMKGGTWTKNYENDIFRRSIADQTVGIIGMGNISRELLKLLKVFGCQILVCSNHMEEGKDGCITYTKSMEQVFREADIITLQLRECEKTRNIIDRELLSLMKPSAYLINTARAGILDYDALYERLAEKKIAGAALDVFPEEPFLEKRFFRLDSVLLTPHVAGDTLDAIANAPYALMKKLKEEGKID